jgi:hypothetical protein
MGVGSAFSGGFGSGAQSLKNRSFMPMVNSLSSIISNRNRGRGVRVAGRGGEGSDTRSQERDRKAREDELLQKEESRYQDEQARRDQEQARKAEMDQNEESRRQETHEASIATGQQTREQQGETFERKGAQDERSQAYEDVKRGLMMRNPKMIQQALAMLAPGAKGEDVVTEGEPVDQEAGPGGTTMPARSFKGRPGNANVPQFIFDPDSDVVGVIFPGQKKPTVFKSTEEAFQNVLAPMNPKFETDKDKITSAKNEQKNKLDQDKYALELHKAADEAGRAHAMRDGYFQYALFSQEQYDNDYGEYEAKAKGSESPRSIRQRAETEKQETEDAEAKKVAAARASKRGEPAEPQADSYSGKSRPKGFPNARRAKNGVWHVKRKGKWVPVLDDEVKDKPKRQKPVPSPPKHPMTSAGVNVFNQAKGNEGPTIIRKKIGQGAR